MVTKAFFLCVVAVGSAIVADMPTGGVPNPEKFGPEKGNVAAIVDKSNVYPSDWVFAYGPYSGSNGILSLTFNLHSSSSASAYGTAMGRTLSCSGLSLHFSGSQIVLHHSGSGWACLSNAGIPSSIINSINIQYFFSRCQMRVRMTGLADIYMNYQGNCPNHASGDNQSLEEFASEEGNVVAIMDVANVYPSDWVFAYGPYSGSNGILSLTFNLHSSSSASAYGTAMGRTLSCSGLSLHFSGSQIILHHSGSGWACLSNAGIPSSIINSINIQYYFSRCQMRVRMTGLADIYMNYQGNCPNHASADGKFLLP